MIASEGLKAMAVEHYDIARWRRESMERQLRAMESRQGQQRFVVGVHNRAADRMWRIANLTAADVLAQEREFARLNVRGRDIYIAPVNNGGLVLVDDLAQPTIERLREDGLAPAAVVETSPANFQVWVRVADEALPRDVATGGVARASCAVRGRQGQRRRRPSRSNSRVQQSEAAANPPRRSASLGAAARSRRRKGAGGRPAAG